MKKNLKVAVLANNAFWAGGIDLVRWWLIALIEKSNQGIIDLYLILPGENPEIHLTAIGKIVHFLVSSKSAILNFFSIRQSVLMAIIPY